MALHLPTAKKNRPAHHGVTRLPPRRILVPLDLSPDSLDGWRQARVVAGWFHADLEAVYVQPWIYSPMGLGVGEPYLSEEVIRGAIADLKRKLGPEAVVRCSAGAVGDGIISWTREGYDLAVMSTHGRTGIARVVTGSVAEYVVRHSRIPVLVVRRRVCEARSIVAPVSLEPEAWGAFLAAAHVAEHLQRPLRVLHVVAGGMPGHSTVAGLNRTLDEWINRLPERIGKACRPSRELAFGSVAEQICVSAREYDLIALSTRPKGLLAETVLGTTAERVLRHARSPVLAIPS
jgi:nucleotide-binding universal stress UspA family protein